MSNYIVYNGELYHHGIKGQRWGVRRFQNPDGSLTAKGIKRISDNKYGANRFSKYDGTAKKQAKLNTSGSYKRALNNVEQGISEEKRYLTKSYDKTAKVKSKRDRINEKIKAAEESGKNTDMLTVKLQKMNDRLRSGEAIVKQHKTNVSRGEEMIKKLTTNAEKSGYSVMSQKATRISNMNETTNSIITGIVVSGPLGGIVLGGVTVDLDRDSKRYSVKVK
jgi:hypothetical protein